ncbi:hypothetical protein TELCIR_08990 [Teladorsagia circumcincta]|uniref:Uncharacterized protein n=1 Tax=Teladorsagia circumcincta TaxID=45464 RepID=A0A2G9UG26_TELCI|nr:hypothetical protein TELCIR_08990 [Teladorsagia circumcincta]
MRAVGPLCQFIDEHYTSTIKIFNDNSFERDMDRTKGNVIAYIKKGDEAYKNLHNVALLLREYCDFWVPSDEYARSLSKVRITFKATNEENGTEFSGDPQNYLYLKNWITDKCIPIVREVTFQNVEGLTEEGLPFLIFFRDKERKDQDKLFIDADLPVLAIDSFVHMFVFPNISQLSTPGVLKQEHEFKIVAGLFVDDLHSGVLHQRYHGQAEVKRQELQKFKQQHNIEADLEDHREENLGTE